MKTLRKYFTTYKDFLNTNLTQDMSFRGHFILLILMDLLFLFSSLMTVNIIYDHVATIGPWSKNQFLFFVCYILCVGQIHMVFVSENFWMFSHDIKIGALDFTLLKPIGCLFIIYFRHIRTGSIPGLLVIHGALIYFGQQIDLNLWHWLMMPIFLLFSLTIKMSIEVLLSLASMWMVESFGLNFLRMQFQQLAKWPDYVYKPHTRILFSFLIPILLTASAPVRFIFNSQDYQLLGYSIIIILISWVLISQVWRLAVKQYESASS